eukprot:GHVH01001484.1.p1 GENE.GHVH01001484.1~~GHVH01001484.1.p1  ORF type:complete len:934 (+),score=99.96 GHVH01001484.1:2522-5323(+)
MGFFDHTTPVCAPSATVFVDELGGIFKNEYTTISSKLCTDLCLRLSTVCRISSWNSETGQCQIISKDRLNERNTVKEFDGDPMWSSCIVHAFDEVASLKFESPIALTSSPGSIKSNRFMNSSADLCDAADRLYPFRSTQFPRFASGNVPNTCEFDCLADFSYDDGIKNCKFKCDSSYSRSSGMSWIGISKMDLEVYCVNDGEEPRNVLMLEERLLSLRLRIIALNQLYVDSDPGSSLEDEPFKLVAHLRDCMTTIPQVSTTDESPPEAYTMEHKTEIRTMEIHANTIFGALHALQTFEGLLEAVSSTGFLVLKSTKSNTTAPLIEATSLYQGTDLIYGLPYGDFVIDDYPKYSYRALMIDTAGTFISVDEIKSLMEQMARAKLNVLHWHITDNPSFPLALGTEEVCTIKTSNINCTVSPINDVQIKLHQKFFNLTDYMHGTACHRSGRNQGNCSGALGPGAVYLRTDLSEILLYAWLSGIEVVFEVGSPGSARSWGAGEADYCDSLHWNGSSSGHENEMYTCPDSDIGYDGSSSSLSIMCRGFQYQTSAHCMHPPCGCLNIQVDDLTGDFISPIPTAIFTAITSVFNLDIDWTTAELKLTMKYLYDPRGSVRLENIFQHCEGAHCVPAKYINSGDYFHLGLRGLDTLCISAEDLTVSYKKWLVYALDIALGNGWIPIAWHDGIANHPELETELLKVVPAVSTTSDSNYDSFRVLLRKSQYFIWNDDRTTSLNCGLGSPNSSNLSMCDPYKTFWDFYNVDPYMFLDLNLPIAINPDLRSLGATAVMFSERISMSGLSEVFPRAAALAGALWTGRDDRTTPLYSNPLHITNEVIDTFDYSELTSQDFRDEREWLRWAYSLAKQCYPSTVGKSAWCSLMGAYGDLVCTQFSQERYDNLYWTKYKNFITESIEDSAQRTVMVNHIIIPVMIILFLFS